VKAILIICHGSSSKKYQDDFEKVVDMVRQGKIGLKVYGASMEKSEPTMENSVERMLAENPEIKEVIVIPFFLFEGMHVKKSIPEKIAALEKKYSEISFKLGRPIGADPMLAEILMRRSEEVF
jgi:sirohydrochlorin cobaltochelatase